MGVMPGVADYVSTVIDRCGTVIRPFTQHVQRELSVASFSMQTSTFVDPSTDCIRQAEDATPVAAVDGVTSLTRPRLSRRIAIDMVRIAETAAVVLAAVTVETAFGFHPLSAATSFSSIAASGLLVGVVTTAILARARVYDPAQLHYLPHTDGKLGAALTLALGGFAAFATACQIASPLLLLWMIGTAALAFGAACATRHASRKALTAMAERGLFDTNIAVIGVSPVTDQLTRYLSRNEVGLRLVGVYDDRSLERTTRQSGSDGNGHPVTGSCAELITACRAGTVDRVIIALPATAAVRIKQLAASFERLPVTLEIATHLTRDLVGSADTRGARWIGPVGLVAIKTAPLSDWGGVAKSVMDYAIALCLLPVLLPVFGVIAIVIKADSPGPVFFRQNRKGFNQQPFRIWKFRTMSVCEDGDTIRQATRGDARVTRVGAFLRRTSLDELPQIINVLVGQMSVIGPRPHALAHDRQWEEDLFRYAGRQQVKPGITGWAQVHGLRGEIHGLDQVKARVDYDLEYIRTWSIWLDIKILVMTAFKGFVNKSAY